MNSVTVQRLSFEFSNGRKLFNNLNFTLESGISALVGPNGVGKTTLAKLLAGDIQPTAGQIRRGHSLTFFSQRQEPEQVSVDQYLGIDYTWSTVGETLLEGINRESLCTTLSGGQWMRVRLAKTLDDQFLILDEPTNDLDRQGRTCLLQFLRQRQGKILLISHDRECLELCDQVLELSNKGLSKFGGSWQDYMKARDQERHGLRRSLEVAERARDKADQDRNEKKARQEKRNRRGTEIAARGGIPKILLGARKRKAQVSTGKIDSATFERAQKAVNDIHDAIRELKIDPIMYADIVGDEIPAQKLVAQADSFNIKFADWLYKEGLNFTWRGNIRLALKGANGSGKSTLLKAILGQSLTTRGALRSGELATLYIDQRCAFLNDEKSIFENVRDYSTLSETEIRSGLARFLFTNDDVFQKVQDLSGGERLRTALAIGFLKTTKPQLIILDEPTNNLDLANVEFLEGLINEFKGALIVISHDDVFLNNCGVNQTFELK